MDLSWYDPERFIKKDIKNRSKPHLKQRPVQQRFLILEPVGLIHYQHLPRQGAEKGGILQTHLQKIVHVQQYDISL